MPTIKCHIHFFFIILIALKIKVLSIKYAAIRKCVIKKTFRCLASGAFLWNTVLGWSVGFVNKLKLRFFFNFTLQNEMMSFLFLLPLQEMFDATLKDREMSFKSAPGTTMFLHWLVGMVYVFYFASFILLLREV